MPTKHCGSDPARASYGYGEPPPAAYLRTLMVGKWSAASRQNTLAAALKEWGRMRRTIHAARYLSDPVYRCKISRQLNKGESLHAPRRDLHYAQQGTIARPHLQDQAEQAWCLMILTNTVITWTTEYYGMAIKELRDRPSLGGERGWPGVGPAGHQHHVDPVFHLRHAAGDDDPRIALDVQDFFLASAGGGQAPAEATAQRWIALNSLDPAGYFTVDE